MITTSSKGPSLAAVVRGEEVQVSSAVVGVARAGSLSIRNGGAVALVAKDSAQFANGYSQYVLAGESAHLKNAGAGALIAGGEMAVSASGGVALVAGNGITMERSGAGAVVTGKAEVQGSYVGIVVSGKTTLGEGAKVLFGTREAIVCGVVCALLLRLLGLGRGRKKQSLAKPATSAAKIKDAGIGSRPVARVKR